MILPTMVLLALLIFRSSRPADLSLLSQNRS
jgi:hypothetical protein